MHRTNSDNYNRCSVYGCCNPDPRIPTHSLHQIQAETLVENKQYRSIMYYRALSMQKMAGLPAASGKAVQRHPEGDSRASTDGKGFSLEDLDSMDKSVQKVFIKSPDYSVLESTGEARCAFNYVFMAWR